MFSSTVYQDRRRQLAEKQNSGLVLFPGHVQSPVNYEANPYPFRQDSSFLYYWGLDMAGLFGILDLDSGETTLFGRERTMDDRIWMGSRPSLSRRAEQSGVTHTAAPNELPERISAARSNGRTIHFLPVYRAETRLRVSELLDVAAGDVNTHVSQPLIAAVVAQRSIKDEEEVAELEQAIDVCCKMHTLAMRMCRPGITEKEVAGAMEGIALSHGGMMSFPPILSVHGEVLHNAPRMHPMEDGDLVLHDAGATSPRHYAGDITRTSPAGRRFTDRQRDIYTAVLEAQKAAIEAVAPGVPYRDVHLLAARRLTDALVSLGLMKGDVDEAVAEGAHTLFFPHGLGHMIGLDVHDMEALGEDNVGYDSEIQRSDQFGLSALRLGRRLEEGFAVTVEPGLYFIPPLIDQWKAEKRYNNFINYERVEGYKDFGGIRIEDDVLVVEKGSRLLGPRIPKEIDKVEEMARAPATAGETKV